MTNPISQAAIDAVAETYEQIADEDHEYRDLIGIDWTIIRDGLEAAMPHIRKQVAEEIIAKQASHDSTLRVSPPHFEYGFNTGMKYAARIAEGESK